jgi:hypothetical protein
LCADPVLSARIQSVRPSRTGARLRGVRCWWVNHKQTFRHEFEGRYFWSPKRKRDGSRNRFYDFLRAVIPGIGDAWDVIGWRVDVGFQRFARPVRPKEHLGVLAPLIEKEQFSPIRRTGDGLQHVYLTSISTVLAEVLLGLPGEHRRFSSFAFSDSQPLVERELTGQREWEDVEQRHILEAEIPASDLPTEDDRHRSELGFGMIAKSFNAIMPSCLKISPVLINSRAAPQKRRHRHRPWSRVLGLRALARSSITRQRPTGEWPCRHMASMNSDAKGCATPFNGGV